MLAACSLSVRNLNNSCLTVKFHVCKIHQIFIVVVWRVEISYGASGHISMWLDDIPGGHSLFYFRLRFSVFLLFIFSSSFLLKREPSQYGGKRAERQDDAPGAACSRGSVSAAAQFKQTPAEVQVAGFLFQFLPEVRRPLLAVRQRRRGTGVEVVPVAGGRKHMRGNLIQSPDRKKSRNNQVVEAC